MKLVVNGNQNKKNGSNHFQITPITFYGEK